MILLDSVCKYYRNYNSTNYCFIKLDIYLSINSVFVRSIIKGVKWISRDMKIFCSELLEGKEKFLLCVILMNILKENDAIISDINIKGIMVVFVHEIILDIIKISLRVLMEGGAEMLIAININHQNTMLGVIVNNPLNRIMLRECIFV